MLKKCLFVLIVGLGLFVLAAVALNQPEFIEKGYKKLSWKISFDS